MANTLVLACAYFALFVAYACLFTTYRSGPEVTEPGTVHQKADSAEVEDEALVQH